jgi:hypothetical protein
MIGRPATPVRLDHWIMKRELNGRLAAPTAFGLMLTRAGSASMPGNSRPMSSHKASAIYCGA